MPWAGPFGRAFAKAVGPKADSVESASGGLRANIFPEEFDLAAVAFGSSFFGASSAAFVVAAWSGFSGTLDNSSAS